MASTVVNARAPLGGGPSLVHWGAIVVAALVGLYVVTLVYISGQTLLAVACLGAFALALFVYTSPKAYTYRYLFPGLAGMAVFVLFPLVFTVWIAFTNYSSSHLLSYERAQDYFLDETYSGGEGASYNFTLYSSEAGFRMGLENGGARFITPPVALEGGEALTVEAEPMDAAPGEPLAMKDVIKRRRALNALSIQLPDGTTASMAGLRKFAVQEPLYTLNDDGTLLNRQNGEVLTPNLNTGFFQRSDGNPVTPGFRVNIGAAHFVRLFTDKAFQGPFLRIFGWTVTFAGLSVLFTMVVGVTLACLLNWEALRFRSVYRLLLFLPYAVPGFISILVFKGLFNNNFGEINLVLNSLFGIRPLWFSDPLLAKVMILIVNTWLGYPYIMVLCMGLLKSIPSDLYEASEIAGVGPFKTFFRVTAPLIIKPLTPLLIASFAFNFNNFVLIALLTGGRPDFLGTKVPAGTTDILVSYTYRIAFEDSGQNFGLAAAISAVIFVMVAVMSVVQLRMTKATEGAR